MMYEEIIKTITMINFALGITYGLIIAYILQEIKWCLRKRRNKLWDDPQWDATDGAHPAWWRGEKYSFFEASRIITEILDGKNDCSGAMQEPFHSMRNRVYILKLDRDKIRATLKLHSGDCCSLSNELDSAYERIHDLESENGKYFEEKTKLQEELDKHTKYEGGVSMKCGHPVQCLYACARVDGGPTRCFVCDLKTEVDLYKEYSYYVGSELTCKRIPKKYSPWFMGRKNNGNS